jgi:hypothetical protein
MGLLDGMKDLSASSSDRAGPSVSSGSNGTSDAVASTLRTLQDRTDARRVNPRGSPLTTHSLPPYGSEKAVSAIVKEFCSYDPDLEQACDIVPEIFRAMLRAWHDPSSVTKPYHHVGGLGIDVGIELAKEIDQVEANYGSE